jgi:hypothetical protein
MMTLFLMGCGGIRGSVPVSPMMFLKSAPAPGGTPLIASSSDYAVSQTE